MAAWRLTHRIAINDGAIDTPRRRWEFFIACVLQVLPQPCPPIPVPPQPIAACRSRAVDPQAAARVVVGPFLRPSHPPHALHRRVHRHPHNTGLCSTPVPSPVPCTPTRLALLVTRIDTQTKTPPASVAAAEEMEMFFEIEEIARFRKIAGVCMLWTFYSSLPHTCFCIMTFARLLTIRTSLSSQTGSMKPFAIDCRLRNLPRDSFRAGSRRFVPLLFKLSSPHTDLRPRKRSHS
jgi:hypothetical protein